MPPRPHPPRISYPGTRASRGADACAAPDGGTVAVPSPSGGAARVTVSASAAFADAAATRRGGSVAVSAAHPTGGGVRGSAVSSLVGAWAGPPAEAGARRISWPHEGQLALLPARAFSLIISRPQRGQGNSITATSRVGPGTNVGGGRRNE